MQLQEFWRAFNAAAIETGFNMEALVTVQDAETGKTFTVKNVKSERHEDMGAYTLWIEVEES